MPNAALMILYVESPTESARFYAELLGQPPAEASATFAMFPLQGGVGLGLWSRHTVEPAATPAGGGGEVAFISDDVDATFVAWRALGLAIAQPPTDMDFGRSFVALDPDGHRLRVFKPSA